ncbi:MAG: Re/Si-specific NAD(P)(+) transhydrogenase subunit alpha [Phycisphaerales bacterium]|nr:Re/Si-specific NAD(P)(+) transhydrogenase subunit alpha [Phycisphaerales bacterium]
MKVSVIKETLPGERRVGLVPESIKKLVKAGLSVTVEAGAGTSARFLDADYTAVGAEIAADAKAALSKADFVCKVQPPSDAETKLLPNGARLLCSLVPQRHTDALKRLAAQRVTTFSTDWIPRTTKAQSMDTLSSMANIAGYKAVIIAANELPRYFPMFMTAAGTVFAAKVFVIGAGVAGLQAIATGRRLGATVEATDTRPEVREQIESLAGRWVGVETQESATTEGGYARELSADFYRKQGELIANRCAENDVVITTALIGGYKAPRLITADMVKNMKPGSVIVDLAAEAGGNCELTKPGETAEAHGVTICAPLNLPSSMPYHASLLWSRNLTSFMLEFWKDNELKISRDDEIIAGCMLTENGEVVNERAKQVLTESGS